ncbi:NCS cytosine-purine permease [Russula emetica]|nr:NCS cytosine-purine permease [Russula emetica]
MEDPTMRNSTKSTDEKHSFEDSVTPTWFTSAANVTRNLSEKLLAWGVEERGIRPVAVEERTETHFINIFFLWFSANTNILAFAAGTLGPVTFGLGLRDSCLVILIFNLISAIPPAYLYYGTMFLSLIVVVSGVGFIILNCILGGQALSSIANISWTNLPLPTGVSGKHFVNTPAAPATVAQIFSFGATLAGGTISWAGVSSDYTAYFHPRVSSWRIFAYSYLGLNIPTITLECLGAAAAISAPSVPAWNIGYTDGNVCGLIYAMLSPVGKFGKVMMVSLSLSVTASNSPTMYSTCIDFQALIPPLVVVPRYVLPVFVTALVMVLSIVGQHKFYATLSDFLGIMGYWAGCFISALCVEHLYFRKGNFELYDIQSWNVPSQLPLGAAALGACALSFALVIPSMSQVWYTGPIARKTGDIGFEVAMAVTALLYIPLRHLEKHWRGV